MTSKCIIRDDLSDMSGELVDTWTEIANLCRKEKMLFLPFPFLCLNLQSLILKSALYDEC